MEQTRRNLMKTAGLGIAAATVASAFGDITTAQAQSSALPPAENMPREINQKINIVNFDLLEKEAQTVMTANAYAYVSGGIGDEWTLRENRRAFSDYNIVPHLLTGTTRSGIDIKTNVLGLNLSSPFFVCPMGTQLYAHPAAETATASGASQADTLFVASGASTRHLEIIAQSTQGHKWFQLYFNNDLDVNKNLLERARKAGYSAIVLTVDTTDPSAGDLYKQIGATRPPGTTYGNHDPRYGGIGDFTNRKLDLTLKDIEYVHSTSGLPVIVKGILRPEDAVMAIQAGAAAIQVSNHGGRQLDTAPSAISALPGIAKAVNKQVPIIFDSGIRRGIDAFKALALGAQMVGVGRPVYYGLAVGGRDGVQSVLEHVRLELSRAMLSAGVQTLKDLTPDRLSYHRA